MSGADTKLVLPANIKLTFKAGLSSKEKRDARNFYWLHKHAQELAANFSEATIRIDQVRRSAESKVRHLDVTGIYTGTCGEKNKIYYTINADAADVIPLFKLTGIELTGEQSHSKDPIYAMLIVKEPRMPLARPYAANLPGGALEPGGNIFGGCPS